MQLQYMVSGVGLWIRNMIDFITWRCCFLGVGFLSFRSWIFHGFLGDSSSVSHSIVSVCLDRVSHISVVLFSTLESRFVELCTLTCCVDCCCIGLVDPFTGSSAVAGWQAASLLGWISGLGYCLCGMHGLVEFNFGKVQLHTRACTINWPQFWTA